LETAEIAVQASLTGHLVLATLHTNDAVSAVTRLLDMGVESFLLASTLQGVLAQRLVRKLCPQCRRVQADGTAERDPQGCPACGHTGHGGRTGVHELFMLDDGLRAMIHEGCGEQALREAALGRGMLGLRQDGERWIREGIASRAEIERIAHDT